MRQSRKHGKWKLTDLVLKVTALALLLVVPPLACAATVRPPPPKEVAIDAPAPVEEPPPPPLYTKLGGKDGVAGILDSFIDNLAADKRLKKAFAKTPKGPKLDHFKQMLADQICDLSGGGCHYTGKTMGEAHAGMGLTAAQFDAFIADFQLALDEKASQLTKEETAQLMDLLTVLKDQIVEKK
jgi:hemoglobin